MTTNWGYEGKRGPEHWHELSQRFACGLDFKWQSPIALNKEIVTSEKLSKELIFHYKEEVFLEELFNNTFHFVPPEKESYLMYDEKKYWLTDIHFHLPSEHTLEEKNYPIEFHLVHMNEAKHNLVVGILFSIDSFDQLIAQKESKIELDQAFPEFCFNPALFLPENRGFYYYIGSLTTPPTIGPIEWIVFDEVQTLSQTFVNYLKKEIIQNNRRPLQPIKDRKVWYQNNHNSTQ